MEQLAEKSRNRLLVASDTLAPDSAPEIPDKLYLRMGEVARLVSIKPYVLRFWESEFPTLMPRKSDTGHRLYRRKDVETVLEIKRLLYEKRFTIEGARKMLQSKRREREKTIPVMPEEQQQGELFTAQPALLKELRQELREILALLA